jgi:hypothetical protein
MRYASVLVLLTVGCVSAPTLPSVVLETDHGHVRAPSGRAAAAVGEMLRHAPEIRQRLDSRRVDKPVVWLLASPRAHSNGSVGVCGPDRIQLGSDALDDLRTVLVHELVHWYAEDSPFADLPHFIEEGLANYLALEYERVAEGLGADFTLTGTYEISLSEFSMTGFEARSLPLEKNLELRDVGCCVVSALGLDRVRELAAGGAAPQDYLVEAGRVSRSP